ncbi:MAG: hypothetical protein OEN21_17325 [Myxococcales bacterium]|nr:hypothetical protein [Myxococcales bacterium]
MKKPDPRIVIASQASMGEIPEEYPAESKWDAPGQRTVMPVSAEIAGVEPVRGIAVVQDGSHGLVPINCYARASELDAMMPVVQQ